MTEAKNHQNIFFSAKIIFGVLVLLFIFFFFYDYRNIRNVLSDSQPLGILGAAFFSFLSISFSAIGFFMVSRLFAIKAGFKKIFPVAFISVTLNNLVLSGGAAGFSLRVLLLRNKQVSGREIISASFFHSYFNFLVILLLLPVSFLLLFLSDNWPNQSVRFLFTAFGLLWILFIFLTILFFHSRLRYRLAVALDGLSHSLLRSRIRDRFISFNEHLNQVIGRIRKKKKQISYLLPVMVLDWLLAFAALWLCFWAVRIDLPLSVLFVGFLVSVTAGIVSAVPGGIGIQESSMAGIFALFGVPIGQAVVAAVLFRIIFYLLPFAASLAVYFFIKKEETIINVD